MNHYWGYGGGAGGPPPPGYPGYPPQGSGAPTATAPPETPDSKASESPEGAPTTNNNNSSSLKNPPGGSPADDTKTDEAGNNNNKTADAEGSTGATPKAPPLMPPPPPGYPFPEGAMPPHYPPYPGYPYGPPPHFAPHYHPHPMWGAHPGPPPRPRYNNNPTSEAEAARDAGATSPTQIESSHRDEVQHMGCTCKKTRCLKLYCQCFGVKVYCGANCRCLQCYNTEVHEKFRKEAMRLILSRNPTAFDTKFKKAGNAATADEKEAAKALTHKLGCKCRKSACMKKYCECYAASVKCSGNCRCMGCKNMGQTHYESSMPPDMKPYEMQVYPVPHLHPGQVMQSAARASAATKKSEQPLQAAQNLAFLKHGTPEKAAGSDKENPDESVNTLMMAAYAMTEFGQGSSPSKSRYDSKKREAEAPAPAAAKKDGDDNDDDDDDDEEANSKRAKL